MLLWWCGVGVGRGARGFTCSELRRFIVPPPAYRSRDRMWFISISDHAVHAIRDSAGPGSRVIALAGAYVAEHQPIVGTWMDRHSMRSFVAWVVAVSIHAAGYF